MKLTISVLFVFVLSFIASGQPKKSKPVEAANSLVGKRFAGQKVIGKVVGVTDGDTITVLGKDNAQYKVRLSGIDAPESKQDFGDKSKKNLSDLIFGKGVTIFFNQTDVYGRFLATVFLGDKDVNLAQIRDGFAWHYKRYEKEQNETDRNAYAAAEAKAREAKKGLWAAANPVSPWDSRPGSKKPAAESTEKSAAVPPAAEAVKKNGGREYIRGPRGGCYYLNASGNKVYVKDKSLCVK